MCHRCEDHNRTVNLLGDLAAYAERPGADLEFLTVTGNGLACSLSLGPAPETGRPSPTETDYPGEEW